MVWISIWADILKFFPCVNLKTKLLDNFFFVSQKPFLYTERDYVLFSDTFFGLSRFKNCDRIIQFS